jgi:hypothetical protein
MAIGDDAAAAGWPLVPDDGEEGRIHWGAREINRTRDFAAQVKSSIPNGENAYRIAAGITIGLNDPGPTTPGTIYFKVVG